MNNLTSYCGLVDAQIRASDKDLPVPQKKKSTLGLKNYKKKFRTAHCDKTGKVKAKVF